VLLGNKKLNIMTKFEFKTTINCGGCLAKVKPVLDANSSITSWSVDTSTPEKVLTVETDSATPEQIIEALAKIGYKAEQK
jgi:copper chaperone